MFYKLIGYLVYHGGKFALRRRYGSAYLPKPMLAGAAVATLAGGALVVAAAAKRNGSS